jgi:hypothetical protein
MATFGTRHPSSGTFSHPGFDFRHTSGFAPRPFSAPFYMQQLHAYWRMEYIEAPRYPQAMKRPFTDSFSGNGCSRPR